MSLYRAAEHPTYGLILRKERKQGETKSDILKKKYKTNTARNRNPR